MVYPEFSGTTTKHESNWRTQGEGEHLKQIIFDEKVEGVKVCGLGGRRLDEIRGQKAEILKSVKGKVNRS
jgi:tRNA A22 N-methylase